MTTPDATDSISRRWIVMLLIGLSGDGELVGSLGGMTRLQKLLFLLEQEEKLRPTGEGFEFEAYKAGPYSNKLYDDLEMLENLGLLESDIQGESTESEAQALDELGFEHLMGDDSVGLEEPSASSAATADTHEERRFALTSTGINKIKELLTNSRYKPVIEGVRRVKSKYAHHSLQDLLHYVYTKYESGGWTAESEIRDKVLKRGRRG